MEYDTLTESEWDELQEVWDLLEDGRLEHARVELARLLSRRPHHPDLEIVDAALLLEEGHPRQAIEALGRAERSADPAAFFHLRGLAHHDLLDFAGARKDAEQALSIRPDMAEAHDLISRVLEHLGDWEMAATHAESANVIDPERYPMPLEMTDEEFDRHVESSLQDLPAPVRKELDDIPVLVEPLPRREVLEGDESPLAPDLLGLFVGSHLLERSATGVAEAPGVIYLFRRNLLRACHTPEELTREIRITVQHEVGHLLGLDEDDLDRWGLA